MEENRVIRVLVAQGNCFLRKSLIERLHQEQWIMVCGLVAHVEDVGQLIELFSPHVLVVNLSLKCNSGAPSLKMLKREYPGLSIVVLSCDSDLKGAHVGQALREGADGYVSAEGSLEDLVRSIRLAGDGSACLRDLTESVWRIRMAQESPLLRLSPREAEVFCLTGCGYVPQRIAEKMNLSVSTIESYRERIRNKMDIQTRADLQYTATRFIRDMTRRGVSGSDEEVVRTLLSATG